jgi:hypothetical protein
MPEQCSSRVQFEDAVIARLGTLFPSGTSPELLRNALLQRRPDGHYADSQRAGEWWAWQASRSPQLQSGSRYVLQDDKAISYLDGQESRFSICNENGEHLAWIVGSCSDEGEAIAHELMHALTINNSLGQTIDIP